MMGTMKTAPKRKVINKQPHQLSYITPREAKILKMLGGSGRITQEGIPAYDSIFGNTFSGSYVSNPSSISDHFQNAMTDLSTGFGFNSGASDATLSTYADRTANNPNNKINDDGTFNGITTNYSGGNNNTSANNTAANNTAGADAAGLGPSLELAEARSAGGRVPGEAPKKPRRSPRKPAAAVPGDRLGKP